MEILGKQIMGFGLALFGVGLLVYAGARLPWLRLGRLPGDISIQRPGFSFYFPLGTCVLVSILVSLILLLIRMVRR